jgi:choline dehydrogenase
MVDLVRPVSEGGEVTLNSADPLQQANINLNYFNNAESATGRHCQIEG